MAKVLKQFVEALKALPEGCALTVTREQFLELVGVSEEPGDQRVKELPIDLTVKHVAELVDRSANTVRSWLDSGELRGYKLRNREWRVTRSALDEFFKREREQRPLGSESRKRIRSLCDWRKAV